MGLFSFLFGLSKSRTPALRMPSTGRFRVAIVGESAFQADLIRICGGKRRENAELEVDAVLSRESENAYDPFAVRVEIQGRTVGHLPRQDAFLYSARVSLGTLSAGPLQCKAKIFGGWDRGDDDTGMFGVWLDVDFRPPKDVYPCPYCKHLIVPTPKRTKTCAQCQSRFVVRNSQPITESEAEVYDQLPGLP